MAWIKLWLLVSMVMFWMLFREEMNGKGEGYHVSLGEIIAMLAASILFWWVLFPAYLNENSGRIGKFLCRPLTPPKE
jgi:hypothetical protein